MTEHYRMQSDRGLKCLKESKILESGEQNAYRLNIDVTELLSSQIFLFWKKIIFIFLIPLDFSTKSKKMTKHDNGV